MKASAFHTLLSQIDELTPSQREQLHTALHGDDNEILQFLAEAHPNNCPHCQSLNLSPWGSSHGLPRFRCKSCGRTSNPLTGTPLARLRNRQCWLEYAKCLIQGLTIREAARECGIAKNTSFLWRHRFLKLSAEHKAQQERGIVEVDETYFLKSSKGQRNLERPIRRRGGVSKTRGAGSEDQVAVLVVRDRGDATADYILEKVNYAEVKSKLKSLINKDVCLCTDGAAVYKKFAKETGIEHQVIIAKESHSRGPYHIQNVNAYDSRLKGWMARFHGVATKYLANYLGWHRMLDRYGAKIETKLCLKEATGWAQQLTKT